MTPESLNDSRVILAEFMRNPKTAREFNDAYRSIDAPLSQLVSEAIATGQLRPTDPDAATGRLLALFKSLIQIPTILNDVGALSQANVDDVVQESVQAFPMLYAPSRL